MKRFFLLTAVAILFASLSFAQSVGIGTTTPNASSILEIKASDKGLLIPRTSTTSRTAIINPAKGLMVYDTTTSSFWYHNGTAWTQIDAAGTGWSLTGNANTDSLVDFIGTTNPEALVFKVNNQRSGFIGYGTSNTSLGYNALTAITTGNYNTANGTGSLLANNSGYNNTASGSYALVTNTAGSFNAALGSDALHNNISGNSNTAIGFQALYSNTTGSDNTANGYSSLYTNSTGIQNTATGENSLHNNKSGGNNTAMGHTALYSITTGSFNTGFGFQTMESNTIGSQNTALGAFANVIGNVSNATAIGYSATAGQSNTIQLGDLDITNVNTYGIMGANGYACKPGINGPRSGNSFNIDWSGGAPQLWIDVTNLGNISTTSDRRLKENIDLMKGNGIERMMELKPVHFKYKKIESTVFSGSPQEQEGFIADELQQVIPSAVNGDKNALTSKGTIQPQTINIVPVVAVLTKAVQEQQQIIEKQKSDIETQKNDIETLKAQVAELTKAVNTLMNK